MIKPGACLKMIICAVIVLTAIPFMFFLLQPQSAAVAPRTIDRSSHSNTMCCPKVYLYSPEDILHRARRLRPDLELHLNTLDPLNTDALMFYQGNYSQPLPVSDRILMLTHALRWLPDVPNRPLTNAEDKLFENSHPGAALFYSKDYVHTFHLRLAVSGCVVSSPVEAELFIVPLSVHTDHPYGKRKGFQSQWDDFFSKLSDVQQIFPHLTDRASARKHVIFSSSFGHSRHSVGLWAPPYDEDLVASIQRVALGSDHLIRQAYNPWLKYVMRPPAKVISAPFSALLTYPSTLLSIAESSADKSILVSAFFEIHGQAKTLRQTLGDTCRSSPHCWSKKSIIAAQNHTRSKMQLVASFLEAKTKSTFCLEPEGDWPTRQSMVQDVLLACIPVFFSPSYTHLWGPFWGDFIRQAAVQLDGAAVLRGELDVIKTLQVRQ